MPDGDAGCHHKEGWPGFHKVSIGMQAVFTYSLCGNRGGVTEKVLAVTKYVPRSKN
jgi:hypothetical protein